MSNHFVAVSARGIQICDQFFRCSKSIRTSTPLLTSPSGNRILAGGDCKITPFLLDSASLQQIPTGYFDTRALIPGDRNLLLAKEGALYITEGGHLVKASADDTGGNREKTRFLSTDTWARFRQTSAAIITNTAGKELLRVPVAEPWKAEFVACRSGKVFGISKYGYSHWSQIQRLFGLLDPDEGQRPDLQTFQVLELGNGREIASESWDPNLRYVIPALAPSGRRWARIRSGVLEVFNIEPK